MGDDAGIRSAFYWIAIGVVGLNVPVATIDAVAHPHAYRAGFAPLVMLVIGVLLWMAVRRAARGYSAASPLRAIVVVSCLALAAHPWALLDTAHYPPLLHLLGAGMSIAAIISVPAALVIVPVFATAVAIVREPAIGAWQAGTEATLLALGGFVGAACVAVFARAGRSVNAAVERSWQLAEEQARLAHRARARERWDGIVHDMVLGALSLAGRSSDGEVPAAARALAGEALDALRGRDSASRAAVDRWREHARRLGLEARFGVLGHLGEGEVREALIGAVNEALTNVARHSGQLGVTVSGHLSGDGVRIEVVDPGQGFKPSAASYGLGLRTSVMGRMRAVGGDAQVHTRPGGGTRVELTWQPSDGESGSSGTAWQLGSFIPMVALAFAVLFAVVVAGHGAWTATPAPALAVVSIVVIFLVTVAVIVVTPSRGTGIALVAVMIATALLGVLNTDAGAPIGWRYWYLSALNPAVAALSYRFGRWSGAWVVAAQTTVVVVVDALVGRVWWGSLTQAVPVLVATVVAAQLIRLALADAWETVEETTRQQAELRVALAADVEREAEAEARAGGLEDVVGADLERLASGAVLEPSDRERFALTGSAIRDQLAAPGLLDAELVAELRHARSRGVDVDVVPERDGGAVAGAVDCDVCRRALLTLLSRAGSGARIRVTWSAEAVRRSTMTMVGEGVGPIARELEELVADGGDRMTVSEDGDALLVEFA